MRRTDPQATARGSFMKGVLAAVGDGRV